MTTRTFVGPVSVNGGTALSSGTVVAKMRSALPYSGGTTPVPKIYYIVDGELHDDANGQDPALITSPANYEFTLHVGTFQHSFNGSIGEASTPIAWEDVWKTSGSQVSTDPLLVRQGDSVERLSSGDAEDGQVLTADGAGGTAWGAGGTGSGSIDNDSVTNAKLANVAFATIKGRATSGTGDPEDLTASQARTLLNVQDGATANSSDATLLARANHTGTQSADSLTDGTTNKAFLATERAKLAAIEAAADVTDAGNVGSSIVGASSKSTPVDADVLPLLDSAASNVLKKLTWASLKATAKAYFDTLYLAITSKASQAEAEAGTDNDKYMTPLRAAQHLAANGGGGGGADLGLTGYVSVMKPDFGVYNDGTHATETTAGLQAAVDYAEANGLGVRFPLGVYLVDDTIVVDADIVVEGVNPRFCMINTLDASIPVFKCKHTTPGDKPARFKNIYITQDVAGGGYYDDAPGSASCAILYEYDPDGVQSNLNLLEDVWTLGFRDGVVFEAVGRTDTERGVYRFYARSGERWGPNYGTADGGDNRSNGAVCDGAAGRAGLEVDGCGIYGAFGTGLRVFHPKLHGGGHTVCTHFDGGYTSAPAAGNIPNGMMGLYDPQCDSAGFSTSAYVAGTTYPSCALLVTSNWGLGGAGSSVTANQCVQIEARLGNPSNSGTGIVIAAKGLGAVVASMGNGVGQRMAKIEAGAEVESLWLGWQAIDSGGNYDKNIEVADGATIGQYMIVPGIATGFSEPDDLTVGGTITSPVLRELTITGGDVTVTPDPTEPYDRAFIKANENVNVIFPTDMRDGQEGELELHKSTDGVEVTWEVDTTFVLVWEGGTEPDLSGDDDTLYVVTWKQSGATEAGSNKKIIRARYATYAVVADLTSEAVGPSGTQYLYEDFTASDGTAISALTPTVGNSPVVTSGTATVQSNEAYGDLRVTWDLETDTYTLQATITLGTTAYLSGVQFRFVDESDCLMFLVRTTGSELVNGSFGAYRTGSQTLALETPYVLKVVMSPTNIECYIDDVAAFSALPDTTTNPTSTLAGLVLFDGPTASARCTLIRADETV